MPESGKGMARKQLRRALKRAEARIVDLSEVGAVPVFLREAEERRDSAMAEAADLRTRVRDLGAELDRAVAERRAEGQGEEAAARGRRGMEAMAQAAHHGMGMGAEDVVRCLLASARERGAREIRLHAQRRRTEPGRWVLVARDDGAPMGAAEMLGNRSILIGIGTLGVRMVGRDEREGERWRTIDWRRAPEGALELLDGRRGASRWSRGADGGIVHEHRHERVAATKGEIEPGVEVAFEEGVCGEGGLEAAVRRVGRYAQVRVRWGASPIHQDDLLAGALAFRHTRDATVAVTTCESSGGDDALVGLEPRQVGMPKAQGSDPAQSYRSVAVVRAGAVEGRGWSEIHATGWALLARVVAACSEKPQGYPMEVWAALRAAAAREGMAADRLGR